MNFMLDSTVGLMLIYVMLNMVSKVVLSYRVTSLFSGEYGESREITPLPL